MAVVLLWLVLLFVAGWLGAMIYTTQLQIESINHRLDVQLTAQPSVTPAAD